MPRSMTTFISTVGILFLVGCTSSVEDDNDAHQDVLASAYSSIGGNLVGLDSLPVGRATVRIYLVGPVPPDTIPPDSTPPDSIGGSPGTTFGVLLSDSAPGDSTPPPPPASCGERGTLAAQVQSNEAGFFRVRGLEAGIYDLRARTRSSRGSLCGVIVRDSQQVSVTIILDQSTSTP